MFSILSWKDIEPHSALMLLKVIATVTVFRGTNTICISNYVEEF